MSTMSKCLVALVILLDIGILHAKWTLELSPHGGKLAAAWDADKLKTKQSLESGARSVYKFLETANRNWDPCNLMGPALDCMKETLDDERDKINQQLYILSIDRDIIQLQKKIGNKFVGEWVDHKYMGYEKYTTKIHYRGGTEHILKHHLEAKIAEGSAQIIYNGGKVPIYINYLGDISLSVLPKSTQNVFDHRMMDPETVLRETGNRHMKQMRDAVNTMDTKQVEEAGNNMDRMLAANRKIAEDKTKLLEQKRAERKRRRERNGLKNRKSDEEIKAMVAEELRKKKAERMKKPKKWHKLRKNARVEEENEYKDDVYGAYVKGYYDGYMHIFRNKKRKY